MKNYYSEDCKTIREYFGLTQEDLSNLTGVSRVTIARLERNAYSPSESSLESIYDYSYESGMRLNEDHASIMEDDKKDRILLFHGSKSEIKKPISLSYSKNSNDFGEGFYAGETYNQAATFITSFRSHFVYAFYLKTEGLNIYELSADLDWMIAISYFRGRIEEYKEHPLVKQIVSKIKACDVLIAPIADNSMYETLNEFADKRITDEQCRHSIRANYLGKQYVFMTDKALDNIEEMTSLYVSNDEKKYFKELRVKQSESSKNKIEMAKIAFRRKGKFIDELFHK